MAKTNQKSNAELKAMLAAQSDVENRWYTIKHTIPDTDLKDPIADAVMMCRSRLQALLDSLTEPSTD